MLNAKSPAARQRVSFVLADAAAYEIPDEADCCFFFNPFALHTLKRVLGKIFDSLERKPRPLRLFFYYPMKIRSTSSTSTCASSPKSPSTAAISLTVTTKKKRY